MRPQPIISVDCNGKLTQFRSMKQHGFRLFRDETLANDFQKQLTQLSTPNPQSYVTRQ